MNKKGFLLLEVLAASAILIFSMSIVACYIVSFSDYRKRSEKGLTEIQNAKVFLMSCSEKSEKEVTSNIYEYVDTDTGLKRLGYVK